MDSFLFFYSWAIKQVKNVMDTYTVYGGDAGGTYLKLNIILHLR